MNKQEFWPKEGKLKKTGIILVVVILSALLITILEEKTNFKHTGRLPFVIAISCIGIWLYQPAKKREEQ
ncbi:MAG TPA: hypothetical protein PLZ10_02790 [Chitinophagaceae bacterium]|nr:hypothetical protein [Chitinophagaceae bacterium]